MNNSPIVKLLRPSSSSRLMKCSGPAWLPISVHEEEDPAGPEGTAAGELFELMVKGIEPSSLAASNGIFFNDEMRNYASKILEHSNKLGDIEYKGVPRDSYHQVQINWTMRSHMLVQGTLDVCWEFQDSNGLNLVIGDYKYGYGIVDVKYNTQLLNYVIGYINLRGIRFDRIYLQIYQPRAQHEDGIIRTQVITFEELLYLKELIERRFDELNSGDRTLVSGPHCRYCPHLAVDCPADARAFNQSVDYVLYDPTANKMTPEDVSVKLDTIRRIKKLIEQHEDRIELYAKSLISQGIQIPSYKLINSNAKRTFKDGITDESIKILCDVEPYKKVLKTPKQLEDEGVNKKIIEQISYSPLSGSYLKKVDDIKLGKKMFGIE